MRILAFAARRAAAGVFVLLVMITITFFLVRAIPNEPAQFVYPMSQHLTDYQLKTGHHLLGLDKPLLQQYGDYLGNLARGNFGHEWEGINFNNQGKPVLQPIGPVLFPRIRMTLSIVIGGALLVLLIAFPLGLIAGRRIGSLADRTITLITLICVCTHPMVIGLILRTIFGNNIGWAPATGYCTFVHHSLSPPECGGPEQWASHLILPWITFALLFIALYTRMVRASVAETMHEDFVRTARAKGASETRVLTRHVSRYSGMRVLTMIGMEIGTAIGVCIYIEAAFGIQGLGNLAITSMFGTAALDRPMILAVVTVITLIVVVGNFVVDLLYAIVDPRAGTSLHHNPEEKGLAGGVI
jgi:peptide/nickel transport system permease protein